MIRKSGNRFSDKIMLEQEAMIRKSGSRCSDKIMIEQEPMIRKSGKRISDKIMLEQEAMIRKSGNRFSEKIMLEQQAMIRKSGNRFSDKIMLEQEAMIRKSGSRFSDKIMFEQEPMIRKSGNRFSDKIMLEQEAMIRKSGNRFSDKIMLERKAERNRHSTKSHPALGTRCKFRGKLGADLVGQHAGISDFRITRRAHIGKSRARAIVACRHIGMALENRSVSRHRNELEIGCGHDARSGRNAGHRIDQRRLRRLGQRDDQVIFRRDLGAGSVQRQDEIVAEVMAEPAADRIDGDLLQLPRHAVVGSTPGSVERLNICEAAAEQRQRGQEGEPQKPRPAQRESRRRH